MVDRSRQNTTLRRVDRRRRHAAAITLVSAVLVLALRAASHALPARVSWSLATAYVGSAAIALTLVIGPLTAIRRRPAKVSSDLRRDIGRRTDIRSPTVGRTPEIVDHHRGSLSREQQRL